MTRTILWSIRTRGDALDDLGFSPKKVAYLRLIKADLHDKVVKRAALHSQQELQTILQEIFHIDILAQPPATNLINSRSKVFPAVRVQP